MQLLRLVLAVVFVTVLLGVGSARAYKVDADTRSVKLVSLDDFDMCSRDFGDGDVCLAGLKLYVEKQPKEAFAAGKRARLQFSHWTALPFFAKAFSKGSTEAQCADPDVSMAVLAGLALPSDNPNVAPARKIAGDQCWQQLQPALVAALNEGGSYLRANACPIVAAKKLEIEGCKPKVEAKAQPVPANTVATQLQGVSWKQLVLDPASGRVLRGRNGEELFMIRTKPGQRDYVLLKFKAIPGPWNGQVFVSVERPGGTGKDYVVLVDQSEWVALTERYEQYQAYAKDTRAPLDLSLVPLDRGQKQHPTPGDVAAEFGLAAKPAAAPAKPAASAKR